MADPTRNRPAGDGAAPRIGREATGIVAQGSDGTDVPNLVTITHSVTLSCQLRGCNCNPEFRIQRVEPFPHVTVHHDNWCRVLAGGDAA